MTTPYDPATQPDRPQGHAPGYGAPGAQPGPGGVQPGRSGAAASHRRPGVVTAALVLSLIGGIFLLAIGALIVFAGATVISEIGAQMGLAAEMDLIAGAVTFVGAVVLVWGALLLIMSIFAFRRASWARWVLIVMGVPAVVLTLFWLTLGDVTALVQLAWIGTSAGLLLTPAARAWYSGPRAAGGYGH